MRRKPRKKCCWLTIPLIRPAISSSCRADPSDTVSSLPPAGYSTDRVSRLTRTTAYMQGRDSNQHARQTSRQSLGHRAGYRPCRRGHAVPTGSPQPSLVDAPCQVGHRAFFFSSLTPTECGEPAGVGRPAPLSSVQPLFPSTSVGPGYVPTASRGRYRSLPRRALRPALAPEPLLSHATARAGSSGLPARPCGARTTTRTSATHHISTAREKQARGSTRLGLGGLGASVILPRLSPGPDIAP